jgi:hypothetical protein
MFEKDMETNLDPRKGAADIKRMGVDKILWSRLRRKTLLETGQRLWQTAGRGFNMF